MSVVTYEGIVENGQIRLTGNIRLPENAKVYVLVLDAQDVSVPRVASPRLVDPRDVADFEMLPQEQSLPQRRVTEFRGAGKLNPVGMDAQEYINQERDSWSG